ncbi:unnamed protein product [Ilex paraguariensis]|uniref:Uncharacterized protein n=1 Tax=Ilex paraguariensis TaxID=185542 RepID=A0ABC8TAL7_9AQUA
MTVPPLKENVVTSISVIDNSPDACPAPISLNKFGCLDLEGGQLVVDLSPKVVEKPEGSYEIPKSPRKLIGKTKKKKIKNKKTKDGIMEIPLCPSVSKSPC